MAKQNQPTAFRLQKKHGDGARLQLTAADGRWLAAAQSLRSAVTAALIVVVAFSVMWVLLSEALGRVFPWMTVVLGYLVGTAIRLAGKGVDWRFPALAACVAAAGSVIAKVAVAASVSADQLGVPTVDVLRSVTTMTWPVFFDEAWNVGDTVFAATAAALAGFAAPRRLNRNQFYALRLWRQEQAND